MMAADAVFLIFVFFIAIYDMRTQLIRNHTLLAFAACGICFSLLGGESITSLLLTSFAAGIIMLAIRLLSGGGMGLGDVKYAAALGLWMPPEDTAAAVVISFLLGGVAALVLLICGKPGNTRVPFGPFLSAGGTAAFVMGSGFWMGLLP